MIKAATLSLTNFVLTIYGFSLKKQYLAFHVSFIYFLQFIQVTETAL